MHFLRYRTTAKSTRKFAFASGLLTLVVSVGIALGVHVPLASAAQDCDTNAIIRCGFTGGASDFIQKTRANDSGNGQHDLQTVYAAYGLEPASYDKFVSSARPGTAYKDGTIVVDGQVVANGALSIGRSQKSYSHPKVIGGTTYHESRAQDVFKSNSIPVYVLFDDKGVMQFAVMTACGNPTAGTPVKPVYSCDELQMTAVAGKQNTYSFTSRAQASQNASFAKFVYDFGDGTTATTTKPSDAVEHTFTKDGSFTVKVKVYVNLPGNKQVVVESGECQKVVKVTVPFYECSLLDGAILKKEDFSFTFVAHATVRGGAKLVSGDFTFGDGKTSNDVKAGADNTVTVTHAYTKAGNYDVSALLSFDVNGKTVVAAQSCRAVVTPTAPPTPECKPGVPVGDKLCTLCPYNSNIPKDDVNCVAPPPPVLPDTGAGDVVAISGLVAIGGFLVYRQLLFRKHKAAFAAAERGTSPLPLAQPLDDFAPLAGTPLAPKKHSFRRKRPF